MKVYFSFYFNYLCVFTDKFRQVFKVFLVDEPGIAPEAWI